MNSSHISKIKKYIFFISIVIFAGINTHLVSGFIYRDATSFPIKGGEFIEGTYGQSPILNPLIYQSTDLEKDIFSLIYRGLLKYDLTEKKLVPDLAICDYSNYSNFKCTLNDANWSNGEKIGIQDVVATLNTLKASDINPAIANALKDATITTTNSEILITFPKSDSANLDVLVQPIVHKTIIESSSVDDLKGSFISKKYHIFSGKYVFTGITEITDHKDLILEENTNFEQNNILIPKIIFRYFRDSSALEANLSSVDAVNVKDSENISSNYFKPYLYSLPQYVTIFGNVNAENKASENLKNAENNIRAELRGKIFYLINTDTIVSELGENNFIKPENLNVSIPVSISHEVTTELLDNLMKQIGFQKKDAYKEIYDKYKSSVSNDEIAEKAKEEAEKALEEQKELEELENNQIETNFEELNNSNLPKEIENPKVDFIVNPEINKYNFFSEIPSGGFLLEGIAPINTSSVIVNGFTLTSFRAGNTDFFYRINSGLGNIKTGENKYEVTFVQNGQRNSNEFFIYYNTNSEELERIKNEVLQVSEDSNDSNSSENGNNSETSNSENIPQIPTGGELTPDEKKKALDYITKYENADERLYYNSDLVPYTVRIVFNSEKSHFGKAVEIIKANLERRGIKVNHIGMPLAEIREKLLKTDDLQYDFLVLGIRENYLYNSLMSYFHSSQADKGLNFANLRSLELDIILEDLKQLNLSEDEKNKKIDEFKKILESQQVVKVLYGQKFYYNISSKVKGFDMQEYLPDQKFRFDSVLKSHVKEERTVDYGDKNTFSYIKYVFDSVLN